MLVAITVSILSFGSLARAQSIPDTSPSESEYINVSEEPHETIPLERLIVYPQSARKSGLEGTVTLDALIGKDGSVEKVNVLKSEYDVFKDAARDAIMREKFTPARQNGVPLKVWITRTVRFRLNAGKGFSNFNQNQEQSNLVNKNHALFNFRKFIGINLDSARDFVRRFGTIQETVEAGGIHLHSETPLSTSGRTTVDGIVGDGGMRKITIVYHSESDEDFMTRAASLGANSVFGGKLVSQSIVTDFSNAVGTIVVDSKERTLSIELIAK